MKIFVIYASAGLGHTKAAQAVFKYLSEREKDAEVRLIDALDHSSAFLRLAYGKGYDFLIRRCQWLWLLIFHMSSLRLPFGLSRKLHELTNRVNARPFYRMLAGENPDLIISTHFLPCQAVSWLKARGKISSCLATVITDFGVHPYWVAPGTDLYAAASGQTREQLMALGVAPEKIAVTGIPIAPGLEVAGDKRSLRRSLGLEPGAFTALLVTGSFGIGPLEEIARLLKDECQVLVVCARNQALFDRLSRLDLPGVRTYGFVQNLPELMSASDVVVTKPGGLSITELLVLRCVPVFISAIPGQETGNVRALLKEGIGAYCYDAGQVRSEVLKLKNDPGKVSAVLTAVDKVRKPGSTGEIYDAIRASCARPAA